jgi:hypothetical protein
LRAGAPRIQRFFFHGRGISGWSCGEQHEGECKVLFGGPACPCRDLRWKKKLNIINDLLDDAAIWRAAGMDGQEIADAIGCCKKALETYFFPSLNEDRATTRAEAIARLYQIGVIDGNVTALKANIVMTQCSSFVPDGPGKAKAAPHPGKKEQLAANVQSGQQETGWGELLH